MCFRSFFQSFRSVPSVRSVASLHSAFVKAPSRSLKKQHAQIFQHVFVKVLFFLGLFVLSVLLFVRSFLLSFVRSFVCSVCSSISPFVRSIIRSINRSIRFVLFRSCRSLRSFSPFSSFVLMWPFKVEVTFSRSSLALSLRRNVIGFLPSSF